MITKEKIAAVRVEMDRLDKALEAVEVGLIRKGYCCVGTRATGAAVRASMDLTRALADLRSSK